MLYNHARKNTMETLSHLKHKVLKTLGALPPQGLEELSQYLDFLEYKYRGDKNGPVVALGGRWRDLPFDVADADVRALRRQVSDELLDQDDAHGIPG
jgi:hypothetical protein